jgi:hypothetical protein
MTIFTCNPSTVYYVTTDIPFNKAKKAFADLNDCRLYQCSPSTYSDCYRGTGLLVGAKDENHALETVRDLCQLAGLVT